MSSQGEKRTEVRLTGFGGQGVVLAGHIIGHACALNAGKNATMIQSFGPEARGSARSATLAICDGEVLYPYINRPDLLVAMSSEGYEKFADELKDDGLLLYERDLVRPRVKEGQRAFGIPSTRIAESLGRVIVQNIVMVGFVAATADLAPPEALRLAVGTGFKAPSLTELNLSAFDKGFEYFATIGKEAVKDPTLEGVTA